MSIVPGVFFVLRGRYVLQIGDEALNFAPVLGRKGHEERNEAFAEGIICVRHDVGDEKGKFLVCAALDVHLPNAVLQPREGDIKLPANVRESSVAGFSITGFNDSNEVPREPNPFRKLLLRQTGGQANLFNTIPHIFTTYRKSFFEVVVD